MSLQKIKTRKFSLLSHFRSNKLRKRFEISISITSLLPLKDPEYSYCVILKRGPKKQFRSGFYRVEEALDASYFIIFDENEKFSFQTTLVGTDEGFEQFKRKDVVIEIKRKKNVSTSTVGDFQQMGSLNNNNNNQMKKKNVKGGKKITSGKINLADFVCVGKLSDEKKSVNPGKGSEMTKEVQIPLKYKKDENFVLAAIVTSKEEEGQNFQDDEFISVKSREKRAQSELVVSSRRRSYNYSSDRIDAVIEDEDEREDENNKRIIINAQVELNESIANLNTQMNSFGCKKAMESVDTFNFSCQIIHNYLDLRKPLFGFVYTMLRMFIQREERKKLEKLVESAMEREKNREEKEKNNSGGSKLCGYINEIMFLNAMKYIDLDIQIQKIIGTNVNESLTNLYFKKCLEKIYFNFIKWNEKRFRESLKKGENEQVFICINDAQLSIEYTRKQFLGEEVLEEICRDKRNEDFVNDLIRMIRNVRDDIAKEYSNLLLIQSGIGTQILMKVNSKIAKNIRNAFFELEKELKEMILPRMRNVIFNFLAYKIFSYRNFCNEEIPKVKELMEMILLFYGENNFKTGKIKKYSELIQDKSEK